MLAYLGLGSNLGDRLAHLQGAVDALRELDPALAVSAVYETAPVGGPEGQGPYLNAVVRLATELSPRELLEEARRLEQAAHRVRVVKDGPRTLDVDLLLIEGVRLEEEDLVVPHPRWHERAFVLAPLEELAPELVPDGWRRSLPGADRLDEDLRRLGRLLS
ncbi:MAG TPA: 2-amino-4-hydroxy-6-hydroxymethyldihydropteridine diphosphokinase [Acidimicrobiales bacterium]|nr:2-amino-4-hydroxy-6-hydroxymethyldihydropteridine diphosphokinase [Acidimicrobiales bacterium]